MDQAVIEQITKLVIENIQKSPGNVESVKSDSLTNDELKRWEQLNLLSGTLGSNNGNPQNSSINHSLNQWELARWSEISMKMNSTITEHKLNDYSKSNKVSLY